MAELNKGALTSENNNSFPNNNTGFITPTLLRTFNGNMIDSLVDEVTYNLDSASFSSSISDLKNFSASLDNTYATDAQLSASASTLQNNINSLSASVAVTDLAQSSSIAALQVFSSSLDATFATDAQLSASASTLQNEINLKVNTSQTSSMTVLSSSYATNSLTASYSFTASFAENAGNVDTGSLVSTASFNAYTASATVTSASFNARINALDPSGSATSILALNQFTASQEVSNSFFVQTGSFNSYTQSNDSKVNALISATGSYATTASNTFIGNQIISGNLLVTGSNINLEVDAPALSVGVTNIKTVLDATASGVVSSADITRLGAGPTGDLSGIRLQTLSGSDTTGDTLLSRINTGVNRHTSTGMTGSVVNTTITSTWATGSGGTRVSYGTTINANAQSASATLTMTVGNAASNNAGGTASIAAGLIRIGTNAAHTISTTGSFGPMVIVGPLNQPAFSLRSGSFEVTTPQGSGSFYTNLPITSSGARINGDLIVLNNITASVISASNIIANSASFQYVQTVFETASIIYSSGSNQFGDELSDVQTLSGSVKVQGSLTVNGTDVLLVGQTASYASSSISSSFATFAQTASEARNVVVIARNGNTSTLGAGTVVHITGASGDNPIFNTASYDSEALSSNTLGVLRSSLASGADGEVIVNGIVLGVNTDPALGYVAGDIIYLSSSGQFTRVQPQAPQQIVTLGQVLRAQQNNGSIYVNISNGWELDELHNVRIVSPAQGDILAYNSASALWENSSSAELGYAITGSNTFKDTQTIDLSATAIVTASAIIGNANAVITDMYVNGGNYDTFNVLVSASNGVFLRDFNGVDTTPFLSVDTNGGNVRIPRNTNITGSLNVSASLGGDEGNLIRGGVTIVGNNNGNAIAVQSGSVAVTSPQGTGFFYSNLPITSSGLRINGTALVADLIVSGVFGGNSSVQVTGNASISQSLFVSGAVTASIVSASIVSASNARVNGNFGVNGSVSITGSNPTIVSGSLSGSVISNLGDIYTGSNNANFVVTLGSASMAHLLTNNLTQPNTLYFVI